MKSFGELIDTLEWGLLIAAVLVGGYFIISTAPPKTTGQTPASITLTAPTTKLTVSQAVVITATVYDTTGAVIPGIPVIFQNTTVAGNIGTLATVNTNTNGVASTSIYFTAAGTYNVDAIVT